jgi:hypothetical protein
MPIHVTRVDEDGEVVRTGPKDWHPEYMKFKTVRW